MGEIYELLLELNVIATCRQHLTREQLLYEINASNERSHRDAEVEQILAENAEYGFPIPADVTKGEIRAARKRFKKNTIFRLIRTGYGGDMGDVGHGQSFTQANRDLVLKKAASKKPLERDLNALSASNRFNHIIAKVALANIK